MGRAPVSCRAVHVKSVSMDHYPTAQDCEGLKSIFIISQLNNPTTKSRPAAALQLSSASGNRHDSVKGWRREGGRREEGGGRRREEGGGRREEGGGREGGGGNIL